MTRAEDELVVGSRDKVNKSFTGMIFVHRDPQAGATYEPVWWFSGMILVRCDYTFKDQFRGRLNRDFSFKITIGKCQ